MQKHPPSDPQSTDTASPPPSTIKEAIAPEGEIDEDDMSGDEMDGGMNEDMGDDEAHAPGTTVIKTKTVTEYHY